MVNYGGSCSNYSYAVLGLLKISHQINVSCNVYFSGRVTFARHNAIYGGKVFEVLISDPYRYIEPDFMFTTIHQQSDFAEASPCVFKYNNEWYAGFKIICSSAGLNIFANGVYNYTGARDAGHIVNLNYYYNDGVTTNILNQEIYNSISTTDIRISRSVDFDEKTEYRLFSKYSIPDYSSKSDAQCLQYYIDNILPYDETKSFIVQMNGGKDYTALVQMINGNPTARSALVNSYNGFFRMFKANSSIWQIQTLDRTTTAAAQNEESYNVRIFMSSKSIVYLYSYGITDSHDITYIITAQYANNNNQSGHYGFIFSVDKNGNIFNYTTGSNVNVVATPRFIPSSAGLGWYGLEMKLQFNAQWMQLYIDTLFVSSYSFTQLYPED